MRARTTLLVAALVWSVACTGGGASGGDGSAGLIVAAAPTGGETALVGFRPDGEEVGRAQIPGEIVALAAARSGVVWVLVRDGETAVSPRLVDPVGGQVVDPGLPSGQYSLPARGTSADGGRTQVVRPDGGGTAYLVDLEARSAGPIGLELSRPGPLQVRYAPEGDTVFVSDFVEGGLVPVADPQRARQLGTDGAGIRFGGFSPDGDRVVYQVRPAPLAPGGPVVVEGVDGSGSTTLESQGAPVGFTADGTEVVLLTPTPDGPSAVQVVNPVSLETRPIAEVDPEFEPLGLTSDRSTVVLRKDALVPNEEPVYAEAGTLATVSLADGAVTRSDVPAVRTLRGPGSRAPWWWFGGLGGDDTPFVALDSRTGQTVVLRADASGQASVLMPQGLQVNPDGQGLIASTSAPGRLLLLDPAADRVVTLVEGQTGLTGWFSPDGRRVAATVLPDEGGLGQITAIGLDGSLVTQVGRGNAATWIAD